MPDPMSACRQLPTTLDLRRPRDPLHGVGRRTHGRRSIAWHGLARTGRDMDELARTCRARLSRDLPRHHRPRPEPVEPGARTTNTSSRSTRGSRPRCSTQLGSTGVHWVGTSMGGAIGTGLRRRAAAAAHQAAHPQPGAERQRAAACADAAVERIRAYAGTPPAFDTRAASSKPSSAGLQALRLAERRAMAAADRNLGAAPAGRPRHAALRPGDGAPVHRPSRRLRDLARTTTRSTSRCCACAAPTRTWCCPRRWSRCAGAGRGARPSEVVEIAGCGHAPALNVPEHLGPIEQHIRAADKLSPGHFTQSTSIQGGPMSICSTTFLDTGFCPRTRTTRVRARQGPVACAFSGHRLPDAVRCVPGAPDMLPLSGQVQTSCDIARASASRLAGVLPEVAPGKDKVFGDLQQRVRDASAWLGSLDESAFEIPTGRMVPLRLRGSSRLHLRTLPAAVRAAQFLLSSGHCLRCAATARRAPVEARLHRCALRPQPGENPEAQKRAMANRGA